MNLQSRIAILTVPLILGLALSLFISENTLLRSHLQSSQKEWIDTIVQAVAESVAKDTINRDSLHARQLLRRIVLNDEALAYIYVTDFDGRLFTHTFDGGFPKDLISHIYETGTKGALSYTTDIGEINEVGSVLIEGMQGRLHIGVNQNETNALIAKARRQLILIALIAIAASIVVALFVGNRISHPLRLLSEQIRGYGKNGNDAKLETTARDPEIRKLTDIINENIDNRMLAETELQQSEARLQAILDFSPTLISTKDSRGAYTMVNQAFQKITALSPEDFIGKTVFDLFPAKTATELHEHDQAAQKQPIIVEEHATHRDGTFHTYLATKFPLVDTEGDFLGTGSILSDITERKQAEERILETMRIAEAANSAKSDFLRSMSHELRTPLNAILGFAQILQADFSHPLSSKQAEQVGHILNGGNHLLQLVNQILDLSRLEADQFEVTLESVDISRLTEDCLALIAPLAEARGIKVVDELDFEPAICLYADPLGLKQALVNLLSNAIKYNRDGGTINLSGTETEDRFFRISVTDTGIGIPDEQKAGVFKMFDRLGVSSAHTTDGAGIGLTVTKLLVEKMEGRIGFESTEGLGSTFWVELPPTANAEATS